jgi:endonuclease/exonuclease/phosphatase family metal-dependent hydrolase
VTERSVVQIDHPGRGSMREVRIATFNLLNGRAPDDEKVDEHKLRRAVAALDADVLALQEVDRHQPRSSGLDLAAVAAEAMGAVDHRFAAALSGEPADWRGATGEEPEGTPAYGVALLSRYPVTAWHVIRLPPAVIKVPYRPAGRLKPEWVRDEPRVAVLADLESPQGPLRVVATHLSFLPVSNGRQLRRLMRSVGRSPGPLVLIGDLNMSPRRARRITGMTALAKGLTFPVADPTLQLDHILCDRRLEARDAGPRALGISDHLALVADL